MRLAPLKRVEVQIGVPLQWPVYDRSGTLLLKRGVIVASESQLRGVLERGYVDQDEVARSRRQRDEVSSRATTTPFSRVRALAVRLTLLQRDLIRGSATDANSRCLELVAGLQALIDQDTDAVLAVLQIDALLGGRAVRHLQIASLSELVARSAGLTVPERQSLACAALSFDIGFAQMQDVLDRQAGPLTAEQATQVSAHPRLSCELLMAAQVADPLWLEAVLQHHERIDGSGYPAALVGAEVTRLARILGIADTYCAMIRPRAYRDALKAKQALRDIFLERGKRIDEQLAANFVREIGIYPPGTVVRLANGEIAVVVRRQPSAIAPVVRAVVGCDGVALLRPPTRNCQEDHHVICDIVEPQRMLISASALEQLWADGPGGESSN